MSTVLQYLQIGMSAEDQNRMTTLVFCVLALVGLLALILLKVRGSRLAAPVNRNGGGVPTTRHLSGLVAAPAFTIAIIAFILLILLNTALSVVQAAA